MTVRRSIVGLCMLCALLVSALAAQGASAETNGTTATSPSGSSFTGTATISGGVLRLHAVISGINIELQGTEVTGTGTVESSVAETGEHKTSTVLTINVLGFTVTVPIGKSCKVKGGKLVTNALKATTAGQGMGLKFEPNEGSTLAKFEIEGCTGSKALESLNGVYELTGSVIGVPTEGTDEIVFAPTPTTLQKTLKLRGQLAGLSFLGHLKTSAGLSIKSSTVATP